MPDRRTWSWRFSKSCHGSKPRARPRTASRSWSVGSTCSPRRSRRCAPAARSRPGRSSPWPASRLPRRRSTVRPEGPRSAATARRPTRTSRAGDKKAPPPTIGTASTWREVGVGLFGESGPFQWRTFAVASLSSAGFAADGIREGRQQGSDSLAEDLALTGRLDFTGLPGLLAGASFYTGNTGQGASVDGLEIRGRLTLFDLHAQYEHRGLRLRALYVRSRLGDAALIDAQNGLNGHESVGERQYGGYLEAAYDVMTLWPAGQWSVIPFVRYERLNPQDRVPPAFEKDPSLDQRIWTGGIGVKPLTNVVLKADYQWVTNGARTGTNR